METGAAQPSYCSVEIGRAERLLAYDGPPKGVQGCSKAFARISDGRSFATNDTLFAATGIDELEY